MVQKRADPESKGSSGLVITVRFVISTRQFHKYLTSEGYTCSLEQVETLLKDVDFTNKVHKDVEQWWHDLPAEAFKDLLVRHNIKKG